MGKFFSSTVNQTVNAFKPGHAGKSEDKPENSNITKIQAIARIIITIVLILVAVYLFENTSDNNSYSEIASTILGAITGYWLR